MSSNHAGTPGTRGVHHLALTTEDMQVTTDFYVRIVGMPLVHAMKVPAGTQPGMVFRLRNKGIPSLRGGGRGDQLVRVRVEVPKKLNEEQQQLLEKFAAVSTNGDSLPDNKSFFDKVKDLFG